ncbi:MAG: hypothetical protein QOH74_1171, partial [Gaiellales bacterium]|nr:hypothetical protein [Gaiellales bacterium]
SGGDGVVAAGVGIHAELAAIASGGLASRVADQLH